MDLIAQRGGQLRSPAKLWLLAGAIKARLPKREHYDVVFKKWQMHGREGEDAGLLAEYAQGLTFVNVIGMGDLVPTNVWYLQRSVIANLKS